MTITAIRNYIDAIEVNYPEAGKDNDSQGFRDNYSSIAGALTEVKNILNLIDQNAVRVASFDGQNDPVSNDLQVDSEIRNGIYNTMRGFARGGGTINAGVTPVAYGLGVLHHFQINENGVVLNFADWPNDHYAKIRIHIRNAKPAGTVDQDYDVTFSTESGGDIHKQNDFPDPLTVASFTKKYQVVEAWTFDGGANVFLQYLGEY
jgi:hypothetical protein